MTGGAHESTEKIPKIVCFLGVKIGPFGVGVNGLDSCGVFDCSLPPMKRLITFLGTALLGLCGAKAAVVLQIDLSDPSAVVITSTGNPSSSSGEGEMFFSGIYLQDFFTTGVSASIQSAVSGNLTTGMGDGIDTLDNIIVGWGERRINLWTGSVDTMYFSTSQPAFVGAVVLDLSAFAEWFPTVGTEGIVDVGNDLFVGNYEVIPEPSLAALGVFGVGVLALAAIRKRRK